MRTPCRIEKRRERPLSDDLVQFNERAAVSFVKLRTRPRGTCLLRVSPLGSALREAGCDRFADRRICIDRGAPRLRDFDVTRVVQIELRERLARGERGEIAEQ